MYQSIDFQSINQISGVERQECEMQTLVATHPSAANLASYMNRDKLKKEMKNRELDPIDERPIIHH